jgi:3-dehydroquinate dehydratase
LEDFVFISMWKLGQETRIEIPKMWWLLSFGSFLNSSAPWQINYKRLYKLITKKS